MCVWCSSVKYGYIHFVLCKYHMGISGSFNHGLPTESCSFLAALLHEFICCVSQFITAQLLTVPGLGGIGSI